MLKFRSMVVGAVRRRANLTAQEGAGPLFKMRSDPRLTRIGSWMLRYSIDETPQLFNVLSGSMSLVGPRSPLPHEFSRYPSSAGAMRRFLVKPGLTGLLQISGRDNMSWEESIRLELRYIENWSLALDTALMWKTIGAIRRRRGAY